jgi:endonuclease/exonuclease/phosphatase family metal-dependent hydrolase
MSMRLLLAWLLLFGACGPPAGRTGASPADPPGIVRVVSWNVHDLFDETADPGTLDPAVSPAEVEARIEAVALALRRLDADVILLQEVERLPLLLRLASRVGYPQARLLDGNDPRGIDVALLSKWPVDRYQGHAGELTADGQLLWPRDVVEAEVSIGLARLRIVGTHLSSRLSDPDGARRRLQVTRLRELADLAAAADPEALVLVGGDLNDPSTAPALAPLLGDGCWLDAVPDGIEAWTWSDGRQRVAFDHLALRAARRGVLMAGWVADGPDVAAASDHRPVVLDVREW